jgi:hypothetical protein
MYKVLDYEEENMAEYYSSFPIQISPFSLLSSELIPLVY